MVSKRLRGKFFSNKLKKFPNDVLKTFKKYTEEVLSDVTSRDKMSKKVYESFSKFQKNVSDWAEISEVAYHSIINM